MRRGDVVGFVEAEDVGAVGVELEGLGAHGGYVVVGGEGGFRGQWRERGDVQGVDFEGGLEGYKEHDLLVCIAFDPVLFALFLGFPLAFAVVVQRRWFASLE